MGIFDTKIDRLEKKREVGKLIKALEHKKSKVRFYAAKALERLGASEAHKPIINAWSSGKLEIDSFVAWAIKETQDAKAVQEIIKQLRGRKKLLRATRQVDYLRESFLLEYGKRIDCLGIIGDISSIDQLIDELKDYWNTVEERVGEQAGPIRFSTYAKTDMYLDPYIPLQIEKALIKIGEPTVEPVIKLLKSDNVAIRETAVELLEKLEISKDVESKGTDMGNS